MWLELFHLITVWFWTVYLISLCLSFLFKWGHTHARLIHRVAKRIKRYECNIIDSSRWYVGSAIHTKFCLFCLLFFPPWHSASVPFSLFSHLYFKFSFTGRTCQLDRSRCSSKLSHFLCFWPWKLLCLNFLILKDTCGMTQISAQ